LVELQGFWEPEDALLDLARRLQRAQGATLSPIERQLVLYAHERLADAFPLRALYAAFKGTISYRQLAALGRRWERNGWLCPTASATTPRRLTAELLELASRPNTFTH
jgi:hypothetical protein